MRGPCRSRVGGLAGRQLPEADAQLLSAELLTEAGPHRPEPVVIALLAEPRVVEVGQVGGAGFEPA